MTRRQIGEEHVEIELPKVRQQRCSLLQIGENFRLCGQRRHHVAKTHDVELHERITRTRRSQRNIELSEVSHHTLKSCLQVAHPHGNLGHCPGHNITLPQNPLLLDARERLIHVRNVRARAHILVGQFAQATTVCTVHLAPASPGGGNNELRQRTVVDGGQKLVERLANIDKQANVNAQLDHALKGPHARAAKNVIGALEEPRKVNGVNSFRQIVSRSGLGGDGEIRAIPGRIVGAVAEFTQGRRGDEALSCGLAPVRKALNRATRQACRR